jgi:carboxypeptidase PM20D1
MKRIIKILSLILITIVIITVSRALLVHRVTESTNTTDLPVVNATDAAQRLAAALRFQTISNQDSLLQDNSQFTGFHQYLEQTFPEVHSKLEKETVAGLSLLVRWQGKNAELKPVLLMSHQDVVPVEAGTEKLWKSPPFAGNVVNGEIYGRGSMDDKCGVLGILEAAEMLLRQNFSPQRTIYFAFGADEENRGSGAAATAALLKSRGIELESVLDEGSLILESEFAGVKKPKALIGISEKGYLTVEISASTKGGHSSMPPANTAVGILSAAIVKLEKNQMPARLEGPVLETFQALGPEMPFAYRLLFSNIWLFRHHIITTLGKIPESNAMIRTTTAPTMLQASPKENVLAREARATINFRLLPGNSINEVLKHVRQVVDDPRISVKKIQGIEASPVSSTTSSAYKTIARTVSAVFPNAVSAPLLVLGGTDARHYTFLSPNVYRFLPVMITSEGLSMVHGTNERIKVDAYAKAIQFYYSYLKSVSQQ